MDNRKTVSQILRILRKTYPEPKTALNYTIAFELLVATILSAQSTDLQVNRITKGLFVKYRSVKAYAGVPLAELQQDVSSINFYKNKARYIQNSARLILTGHGGDVPNTMAELIRLPGVARKTANIVLSSAFGVIEGIAVDTHVRRLSQRLGLTDQRDPVKIEADLMKLTARKNWPELSHLLIYHGRKVCSARKPLHEECGLYDLCPSRGI